MFVITLKLGGTSLTLGDTLGGIYVSDYQRNGQTVPQIVKPLRAADVTLYDRGNFESTITFKVSRVFDSPADCMNFLNTHPEQLAGVGILSIVINTDLGLQAWVMPKAKAVFSGEVFNGLQLFGRYTITGGKIK